LYLAPIKGAAEVAAGKAKKLVGAKVLGPRTLRLTLTGPYAYFLNTLTYPTADVLDQKHMAGKKVDTYLDNNCKGNQGAGPFEFVCTGGSGHNSFFPSGHSPYFEFKPNPYYYGPKPHVMIYSPFIADADTQWKAFRAGAIDATSVPTADLGIAKGLKGYAIRSALETDYITPNQAQAPFNNINCRLAVAYGINRFAITEQLLRGTEGPLYDVLPPGLPNGGQGYFGSGKKEGVPYYNPAKAKAYLQACPGNLKGVTMTYQSTGADVTHEYTAIAFELNQLGAQITLKPLNFNAWLNVVGQSMTVTKTQITENLWIDDYPDAQDWLAQLLQTGANYDIGSFSNHTYDQLVNQGNVTFNPARRAAIYKRAQKLALNNGAWIGVGFARNAWVVRPSLHNIIYTDGNIYPKNNDWSLVS
jgi:peptide/nickel transport system substrate-binding protein/oligopeptide transport system substrate-binding protein